MSVPLKFARCASHGVEQCPSCGSYLVIAERTLTWRILISHDGSEGMRYSPDLHRNVPDHSCSELCERDVDGRPMRLILEFSWPEHEFEVGQLTYDVYGHGEYRAMEGAPPPGPDWNVRRWRMLRDFMGRLTGDDDVEYAGNVFDAMKSLWAVMTKDERLAAGGRP